MKALSLIVVAILGLSGYGQQQLFVLDYDWDAVPDYEIVEGDAAMMALKEKYVTEFSFSDQGDFTEHYLEHKALWLNSNDKIEDYNKVYLPYSSNSELVRSKARVTNRSGKVIDLDESKILTAEDAETGKNYKYFAFEGLEKGSVIEYFYVERKKPGYNGTTFRLQSDFRKKNVEFDLFAPSHLLFDFKSYNGLPEVVRDTLDKERAHWQMTLDDLEALEDEAQASYNASRGFLVYKLDKNQKTKKVDLSSYGSVAQNIYEYYHTELDKNVKSSLNAFMVETTKAIEGKESKIRALDNAIKSSFILSESGDESLKDLKIILEKKVANATGFMKLYLALFRQLEVDYEIVITSDRTNIKFDNEFEAHNFLTDFLIYFPGLETYVSPNKMESRYGYPPAQLTDNYGLFIKEVNIGGFKSAIGKIKYIEPLGADKTVDRMEIDVKFEQDDLTSNAIQLKRSFTGYYAMPFHPYMGLIVGENRENMFEGLAKTMNEDVEVENAEVINEDPALFGVKPIEFVMDVTSNAFVEKAGNKYLFKIGELIGPQMQMYQEKKRVLPLENEHTRSYYRTIKVHLPQGYKVANLDDLNIKNTYESAGQELFSFWSFYDLKEGLLNITADEHYRTNLVPPSIFQEYRKVINTAADFNKIILILEPEG